MKAAKFVVGLITAVAVTLSTLFAPDSTVGQVVTIVLAVAGAIGVYLVPNKPDVPPNPGPLYDRTSI
jgi:uncharacterized membrane protein YdcZ (DUF606 family)